MIEINHSSKVNLSVVIPVFNEEEVIAQTAKRLIETLSQRNLTFELVFVDDGSRDKSFDILRECRGRYPGKIKILSLARNFGHQLAITAGLKAAIGDAVVVTDSDLQDPPSVILQFIDQWKNGYQVVYGVRTERKGETVFKKMTAVLFYKLLRAATKIDIPENAGDFYLLDRSVVDVLNKMDESHRFMRGLIVWVGFKRIGVPYTREPRLAGTTKYGFWKMVKFAFDAATSFSFAPLRAISFLGFVISFFAFLSILIIIYLKLFTSCTITGWSSLMAVVLFIGGIQLLAMGMIGEYIARIGDDVKRRPLYTVRDFIE